MYINKRLSKDRISESTLQLQNGWSRAESPTSEIG